MTEICQQKRCDLDQIQGISAESFEASFNLRKFQVMPENCRKISRYAGQEFHLMPELST